MHAFQAIAVQKNTNLAVVAPSIAEALFATAIGLAAAIPAYIAYNKFSTDAGKFGARLEGFADDLSTAIARRIAWRSEGLSHGAVGQRRLRRRRRPRRRRGRRRRGALSEINVTPLVDVMLVLLIIFMISAPAAHRRACRWSCPRPRPARMQRPDRAAHRLDPRATARSSCGETETPFADLAPRLQRHGQRRLDEADLRARRRPGALRGRSPR